MSTPTILDEGSKTKAYESSDSSGNRTFDISVPLNANVVAFIVMLNANDNDSNPITGLTHTGLTGAVELFDIDASRTGIRATRIGIYDVSECGAGTLEITAAASGSTTAIAGAVATDGFIESFTTFVDRTIDRSSVSVHSGNDDNILVLLGVHQGSSASGTFSTGTQIFKTNSSDDSIAVVAGKQTTTTNGLKTINYDETAVSSPFAGLSILFSTQKDPFDGITGKLTSPVVK